MNAAARSRYLLGEEIKKLEYDLLTRIFMTQIRHRYRIRIYRISKYITINTVERDSFVQARNEV